jgi:Domain of unknown function (DUF4157)
MSKLSAAEHRKILTPPYGIVLQRKCACGQHTIAGSECPECGRKREVMMQRSAVGAAPMNSVPSIVHDVLSSSGHPLDSGTRAFMEPRFGHDFSQVKVHTDAKAAESAQAVNALAYTVGRDVVFASEQYEPRTTIGRELLAHELTHTIQQDANLQRSPSTLEITSSEDASEKEASLAAKTVIYGQVFTPTVSEKKAVARETPDAGKDAERQFWLALGKQPHYGVLEKQRRTPMAIQTRNQQADEILWTFEAELVRADEMRTFLKTKFGADRDLRVTSIVKPGEHTIYRKMDVVPAGKTTWEELAAAAVPAGFWVHAEGVTRGGKLWPLSPKATGPHLDLYLINKQFTDFPLPSGSEFERTG